MAIHTGRSAGISPATRLLGVVALGWFLAGCGLQLGQPEYRTPTEAEAKQFLADAVERVKAGDFVGLCEMTGGAEGNCPVLLQNGVQEAAPSDPPQVAGSYEIPDQDAGEDGQRIGGRVLVVCGTDATNRPYRTELLIFWQADRLTALHPVYWSDMGASSGVTTSDQPTIACP